ncbi:hypothetical protein BLA60_25820 [Actinophytocola xinjiangensis]|uniref:SAP domain-containing protein n=1 Tax=Actinophytocola xinjiangensis TaxID=485602 RepID=A0A7Z1AX46_9PSEU|nr:SAP domain-containing protein [Actinophytocola xinjiangensis]OLF07751.1 hypothetical protein BLA60_25820 [Actinophytocola xinjiangensis]
MDTVPDYEEWDYPALQAECKRRDLLATGKKEDVILRLMEDDESRQSDEEPAGTVVTVQDVPAALQAEGEQRNPSTTEPAPVKRIRVNPPRDVDRPRAGGHVLTERGWVPDQPQES